MKTLPKAVKATDERLAQMITNFAKEAFEPNPYARVHKEHLPLALDEVFARVNKDGTSAHPELGAIVAVISANLEGDYQDYDLTAEALYSGLVHRQSALEGQQNVVSLSALTR